MKTKLHRTVVTGALAAALTLTSCVNPYAGPNEQNGAVVGAVGGGVLGAIIGNQSGRPLEGAAIGGLLGSLAGSQIGASRDQRYFYGGWNRYHQVRGRPVYVRRTVSPYYGGWSGYPYGRTGVGFGYPRYWGPPYRSGLVVGSFGRPAFGYGGWGYNPYCW
ncbi:MAG: glycine zipper 2TM domain-containing protein [Prosthecobacter sp.]|jgi:hypothetical protein|nr:glycine zipper 2TM domain-containing protein [Prosthecobacter sp.]